MTTTTTSTSSRGATAACGSVESHGGGGGVGVLDAFRLHEALQQGKPLSVLNEILSSDPSSVQRPCRGGWRDGYLPLHLAAYFDSPIEVVQLLLDSYPEALHARNHWGCLPLHSAAQRAKVEVVQLLADKSPEALMVRTHDDDGWLLPLHTALLRVMEAVNDVQGAMQVVECLAPRFPEAVLEKFRGGCRPLHRAALCGAKELVHVLADACPPALVVKDDDDEGRTPLHVAAQFANWDVVQGLVDKDPGTLTIQDNCGNLPLHVAAERGEWDIVRFLMERGPGALHQRNHEGWRPVHVAARHGAPLDIIFEMVRTSPLSLE